MAATSSPPSAVYTDPAAAAAYPQAAYPPPAGYPTTGYPPTGYPPSGYPPTSSYPEQSYPPQAYQQPTYPAGSYPAAGYSQTQGYVMDNTTSAYPTAGGAYPAAAYTYPETNPAAYPSAPPDPAYGESQTATSSYGYYPEVQATHVADVAAGSSYSYSYSSYTPYTPYSGYTSKSYVKGWGPTYDPFASSCATITDTGKGSAAAASGTAARGATTPAAPAAATSASTAPSQLPGTGSGAAGVSTGSVAQDTAKLAASKRYEDIVKDCLKKGSLWEDTDFPARDSSLFYKTSPGLRPIEWKRPNEICSNATFAKGASRMDVQQGKLGDCWLLAAVADLTTNPVLFSRVVPQDQTFDKGKYAGIFRFYFWQYGHWVEVLIDDRLPTYHGKLIYMSSDVRNEFWSSLLEKAYAKLVGSYEALSGGLMSESFEDFTGGMAFKVELRSKAPPDLFPRIVKGHDKGALLGCSIDSGVGNRENQLPNGLIIGHAYSITNVAYVEITNSQRQKSKVPLLRIRNPWGDDHEWKKAWSDKSSEWSQVSEEEKKRIGAVNKSDDGEFWMCFDDFVREFERLEFCLLGPDSGVGVETLYKNAWEGTLLEGSWKRRVNAGGCRNYPETFWTNPQYKIHVSAEASEEKSAKPLGTIVVGLMQKNRRQLRKEGKDNLSIGYVIFQLTDPNCGTLGRDYFDKHKVIAKSPAYVDVREVAEMHKLDAGDYVIVVTTYEPNQEGDFILRVFHEKKEHRVKELDDDNSTVTVTKAPIPVSVDTPLEKKREDEFYDAFQKSAVKGQLDAYQLREILNRMYAKELRVADFSADMCRSLVSLHDTDLTGKLNFVQYKEFYKDFHLIEKVFKSNDKTNSGYVNSYEMRTILHTLADQSASLKGLRISNSTFNAVAMRYSNQEGKVFFDDFLVCVSKLKMLFVSFRAKDAKATGVAAFHVDEMFKVTNIGHSTCLQSFLERKDGFVNQSISPDLLKPQP